MRRQKSLGSKCHVPPVFVPKLLPPNGFDVLVEAPKPVPAFKDDPKARRVKDGCHSNWRNLDIPVVVFVVLLPNPPKPLVL